MLLFDLFLSGHHNCCHNHKGLFSGKIFLFFHFFSFIASTKILEQWAIVKICVNNTDFPICFWSRPKAFNCFPTLKHKFDMFWSNRRRSSVVMPSSFTDLVDSIVVIYSQLAFSFTFFFIQNYSLKLVCITNHLVLFEPTYSWFRLLLQSFQKSC